MKNIKLFVSLFIILVISIFYSVVNVKALEVVTEYPMLPLDTTKNKEEIEVVYNNEVYETKIEYNNGDIIFCINTDCTTQSVGNTPYSNISYYIAVDFDHNGIVLGVATYDIAYNTNKKIYYHTDGQGTPLINQTLNTINYDYGIYANGSQNSSSFSKLYRPQYNDFITKTNDMGLYYNYNLQIWYSNIPVVYVNEFPPNMNNLNNYVGYEWEEPTPEVYVEKYKDSGTEEIKTFDIYKKENGREKNRIRVLTTEDININSINKVYYGKIKHGETAKWEQINISSNYVTFSNENITIENVPASTLKLLTYTFETNYNIGNYDTIRIGLELNIKNWDLTYENISILNGSYYDINIMDKKFNLDIFEVESKTFNGLKIDSINDINITYNFWQKNYTSLEAYGSGVYEPFALPSLYNKEEKIVGDTIPTELILKTKEFTYFRRYIKLGSNSKNALYYYLYNEGTPNTRNYIYFTTEVYYTLGEGLNFIYYDWQNDTFEEENYNIGNEWINSNMSQFEKIKFNWIKDFLHNMEDKKEQWLLFTSQIWRNLNEWIQNLILFLYFMLHMIGIFILFKD